MSYPVFPTIRGLTWQGARTPQWDTLAQRMSSGKEFRLRYWNYPLYKWELNYSYIKDNPQDLLPLAIETDLAILQGFFQQMAGQYDVFLYDDTNAGYQPGNGPWDSVQGQTIGSGDGVTDTFQLIATIGGFDNAIQAPFSADGSSPPPVVYLNGIAQTYGYVSGDYWIDDVGQIRFVVPPPSSPPTLITADMSYYWPVRFGSDELDFDTMMFELWELKKITLQQVRL